MREAPHAQTPAGPSRSRHRAGHRPPQIASGVSRDQTLQRPPPGAPGSSRSVPAPLPGPCVSALLARKGSRAARRGRPGRLSPPAPAVPVPAQAVGQAPQERGQPGAARQQAQQPPPEHRPRRRRRRRRHGDSALPLPARKNFIDSGARGHGEGAGRTQVSGRRAGRRRSGLSRFSPSRPAPPRAPELAGLASARSRPAPRLGDRCAGPAPERTVLRPEGRASVEPRASPVADLQKGHLAGS